MVGSRPISVERGVCVLGPWVCVLMIWGVNKGPSLYPCITLVRLGESGSRDGTIRGSARP